MKLIFIINIIKEQSEEKNINIIKNELIMENNDKKEIINIKIEDEMNRIDKNQPSENKTSSPLINEEEKNSKKNLYDNKININIDDNDPNKTKTQENILTISSDKNMLNISKREEIPNINGDIFHNKAELDFISKHIHRNKYKIRFNLLYKASKDGDKSSIFHSKCDKAQTTLVLIETKSNKRFGGYTKRTWRGTNVEKNDNDAFIFSLDNNKIYNINKGKKAIGCYLDLGPNFVGCFKIYDNSLSQGGCLIYNGDNYDISNIGELINNDDELNEIKNNMNDIKFDIKEIEFYEIKIA